MSHKISGGRALLPVLAFTLIASCGSVESESQDGLRVLFVGNSLTYTNDLPAIVAALAASENERPLIYGTVAIPNFSLEDHWKEGTARKALTENDWDVVVMQQGPSSLPESREQLIKWAKTFAKEARANDAEPALFTVWPSFGRSHAFPAVIESYAAAADSVDGILLPAGAAWIEAWEHDPSLALYGQDDFHPSELGSYLSALVIYAVLYDESPRGLTSSVKLQDDRTIRVPDETAKLLQEAAEQAIIGREEQPR